MSTENLNSIVQTSFNNPAANGEESLALKYENGDCSLQVNLNCDKSLDTPTISTLELTKGTECTYTTTFTGPEACPSLDLSTIWDFF